MAAYAYHARVLGKIDDAVDAFFVKALAALTESSVDVLLPLTRGRRGQPPSAWLFSLVQILKRRNFGSTEVPRLMSWSFIVVPATTFLTSR